MLGSPDTSGHNISTNDECSYEEASDVHSLPPEAAVLLDTQQFSTDQEDQKVPDNDDSDETLALASF